MNLGENIKQFRKVRNLTQSELSQETGIPRSTIQKYESGLIQNIPLEAIPIISKALDISPTNLVGWLSTEPHVDELVNNFLKLNDEDQLLVLQLASKLTKVK